LQHPAATGPRTGQRTAGTATRGVPPTRAGPAATRSGWCGRCGPGGGCEAVEVHEGGGTFCWLGASVLLLLQCALYNTVLLCTGALQPCTGEKLSAGFLIYTSGGAIWYSVLSPNERFSFVVAIVVVVRIRNLTVKTHPCYLA
jgi:hypothetical protein